MDDRLDAARALLGVSPSSVAENGGTFSGLAFGGRATSKSEEQDTELPNNSAEDVSEPIVQRRPRSNSAGLDALAFLATKEQASMEVQKQDVTMPVEELPSNPKPSLEASAVSCSSSSSSDEDSEAMPPPPPRAGRRRSVSNPEGMEKWAPRDHSRLRFVLPAAILEEELAEANAAMKAQQEKALPLKKRHTLDEQEDLEAENSASHVENSDIEENMDQNELLRRARSRLLEDLSEGNLNGEKGVLTLPHSLAKYKDVSHGMRTTKSVIVESLSQEPKPSFPSLLSSIQVYNKNGRIGIYTPAERAAIISRFNSKRERRVWNKKIRYNCRKNLADRRMRVKGRFVKRSTEESAKSGRDAVSAIPESEEAKFVTPDSSEMEDNTSGSAVKEEDMPDVNDPDAGFCPTDDQPYRRCRRHTIT